MIKRRIILSILGLALVIGIPFAARSIRDAHYPIPIKPSESWEPFVSSLNAQHESFFVESNGLKLEADLFIPNSGADQKPAVVFTGGSGDGIYQNYAFGLVETYILDDFLSRDFAVLLFNKRGMGASEGNYVKNSIQGRVDDVYAAAQSIQTHPQIDADNIGLAGHSQGGWVVTQAAADHLDIAFFINLAGPTYTMRENSADNSYHYGVCQGMQGEVLEAYLEKRSNLVDLSIKIGNLTNFGYYGFDARNMGYDPWEALQTIQTPGLFVYGENDALVTPSLNIDRLNDIFSNQVPNHLSVVVIDGATHIFRLVKDPCGSFENPEEFELSKQPTDVIHSWLAELGY